MKTEDIKLHEVVPEKMGSMKEARKAKIYPTVYFDEEDLPEIKNWKVGDHYYLVMEVEEIAMRQGKEWQGDVDEKDNKMQATFKVLKVGGKEEDFESEYGRKRGNAEHN
jgi:hypothetical protein